MDNWRNYLSSDPAILFGKMVITSTRIPVDLILEKLANNFSFDELIVAYPQLTNSQIRACLAYAAENAKHDKTISVN
jgi:uncharacterized protein (DUF433 family)